MRLALKRERVFLQIDPREMGCAPMKKALHFTGQLQRLRKRARSGWIRTSRVIPN